MNTRPVEPNALPDKISDLLELALKDAAEISKDPKFEFNMKRWHFPSPDGKCLVCLSGSVMARTLKVPFEQSVCPGELSEDVCRKLSIINEFRYGSFNWTNGNIQVEVADELYQDRHTFRNIYDPLKYNDSMVKAIESSIRILRRHNL